jgi:hypothetical protein
MKITKLIKKFFVHYETVRFTTVFPANTAEAYPEPDEISPHLTYSFKIHHNVTCSL